MLAYQCVQMTGQFYRLPTEAYDGVLLSVSGSLKALQNEWQGRLHKPIRE
ncbi:hypothetical protein GCM10028825_06290 [Spirosoma agri]